MIKKTLSVVAVGVVLAWGVFAASPASAQQSPGNAQIVVQAASVQNTPVNVGNITPDPGSILGSDPSSLTPGNTPGAINNASSGVKGNPKASSNAATLGALASDGSGGSSGVLSTTGADVTPTLVVGSVLLAIGGLLIVAARRRNAHAHAHA